MTGWNAAGAISAGLGAGPLSASALADATRYESFLVKAQAAGIPLERASAIVRGEAAAGFSFSEAMRHAEARLHLTYEYGYLPMILRDVLDPDELTTVPFSSETILNDWRWMPRPLGRQFAEMAANRQRSIVEAAIELTAQLGGPSEEWPLERAVAAVMPYSEAPVWQPAGLIATLSVSVGGLVSSMQRAHRPVLTFTQVLQTEPQPHGCKDPCFCHPAPWPAARDYRRRTKHRNRRRS